MSTTMKGALSILLILDKWMGRGGEKEFIFFYRRGHWKTTVVGNEREREMKRGREVLR